MYPKISLRDWTLSTQKNPWAKDAFIKDATSLLLFFPRHSSSPRCADHNPINKHQRDIGDQPREEVVLGNLLASNPPITPWHKTNTCIICQCEYSHYIHIEGGSKAAKVRIHVLKAINRKHFPLFMRVRMQARHSFTQKITSQECFHACTAFVPRVFTIPMKVGLSPMSLKLNTAPSALLHEKREQQSEVKLPPPLCCALKYSMILQLNFFAYNYVLQPFYLHSELLNSQLEFFAYTWFFAYSGSMCLSPL